MKKLNKFDIFMSIALFCVLALGVTLVYTSCTQSETTNISTMEYYDAEDGLIPFYADGVINFIYHTQDNEYVIEYGDDDAIDQEAMLYNDRYGYHYAKIYCDSADFYEYLNWYNTLNRYDERFRCSNATFGIYEDSIVEYDKSVTYYYHLQKRH